MDLYCVRCSVEGAEDTEGEEFHRWEWLEMSQWPFETLSPSENWTGRDLKDHGAQDYQLVGTAYVDLEIPSPWGPNLEVLIQ